MSKHKIHRHYEPRIVPHKPNYEILDWASAASQQARFAVLADNVQLDGQSLLDVGCGLGDLWDFLKHRKRRVDYTGVDIVQKMVDAARARHRDARFICADIFVQGPSGDAPDEIPPLPADMCRPFDVVFCSGALNLNLGNNLDFMPMAVRRMCQLAGRVAVFNLLHHRTPATDSTYFYYDPEHVRSVLAGLDVDVTILDNYLPNDFTAICRKR